MSVATGYIALIIDVQPLNGEDAKQPCNQCVHGHHIAPEHLSGKYLCTYQTVDCPLCGKTGIRTRPRVRHILTLSP